MKNNKLNLWFGALLASIPYNDKQERGQNMDNIKTGALIRELRKEKNMTQKELAGLLHVTDRAVSKWERGLCAPDISLLEPLAAALGVTVMELISGERLKREEYTDEIDLAVKNIITYSENEITQKTKALKKKVFACILLACLALLILIPALNGVIWGDGFSWECIPAYWCAQKAAEAIQAYDEKSIQTYIGNSEGVFTALSELKEQGVMIQKAEAKFSRTRLEDMFLLIEVDFIVMHEEIKYMFWYNRVKKLEKNHVSREQLEKAQSALKQFRKEAGQRKKQIQNGELSTVQFMNWMIGQEAIIQEICGG